MITFEDYFGPWIGHHDVTEEIKENARTLLSKVNVICESAFADGVDFTINPKTNSYISGQTLGGFRPQDATQGAAKSSHKEGKGIDIYDPMGYLDQWCMNHQSILMQCGLFLEHPSATNRWTHLQTRPPASHKTVFYP